MAEPFLSGKLPEPMRRPQGSVDEAAAALAERVSAADEQSVAALVGAILAAGFGVRDPQGGVVQTVQPGQGLAFADWEVAAMAKMYGEGRTVELSYLTGALASFPELKRAPLDEILLSGIRQQALSREPALRFWARFIAELGRRSAVPYDLLAATAPEPKAVRLDAVQSALILRRLYGDLYAYAQSRKQARRVRDTSGTLILPMEFAAFNRDSSHSFAPASPGGNGARLVKAGGLAPPGVAQGKGPCNFGGEEEAVLDAAALGSGYGWDKLLEYLESRAASGTSTAGTLARYRNIAGAILAYAQFVATYAALKTEVIVENPPPPLVRRTDKWPGGHRKLTATVRMDIGNWENLNCIRTALNVATGLDFDLLKGGALEGVDVNWILAEGGTADAYHSGDRDRKIVQFRGSGGRIQDAGTYAGAAGQAGTRVDILTRTKTNKDGKASIILEGAGRGRDIPAPHLPVMKRAVVWASVTFKSGDLKGDLSDVIGQALGGVAGLVSMPAELLYRTNWAVNAAVTVPVKDWETCERDGWQGTITYKKEFNYTHTNSGEKGHDVTVRKESLVANFTVKPVQRISQSGEINMSNTDVQTSASYNETYKSRGTRACNRPLDRTTELSGDSQTTGSVGVLIHPDMRYWVGYQVPMVSVEGEHVTSWKLEGDCKNPFMDRSGGSKTLKKQWVEPAPVEIEGAVDPKNPHELIGSKTETIERNGGTTTITVTWKLSRCTTHLDP